MRQIRVSIRNPVEFSIVLSKLYLKASSDKKNSKKSDSKSTLR